MSHIISHCQVLGHSVKKNDRQFRVFPSFAAGFLMAEEKHGVHLIYVVTYGYHGNTNMQVQKIWEDSGAS